MEEKLPFFNLSLKKVFASESDSFKRARLKIVFSILFFTLLKVLIVFPIAIRYGQNAQLFRAIIVSLIFLFIIKVLMYRPSTIGIVSHLMLTLGILVIWSNLFIYIQDINLVTIQVVFMTMLVSFYLLRGWYAAVYTFLAVFSVVFFIFTKNHILWHSLLPKEELASPGYDVIVVLNFFTFIISHYFYNKAFRENLKEKENLNQQLQVKVEDAKALAHSRSVFLSTMSHELRTPLNGVIGMTNLLMDSALDEQKENLNVLEFSATNLLAMINDILDYNKGELDKIELEALPVNLFVLFKKICYGLEIKATEKALTWELDVDEILNKRTVVTDPTRLTQIVYNLAGNAIKFTNEGMVRVSARALNEDSDCINILFSIQDTGIGIPHARQEAIFDPFTQASSDTTRKYGGTGLGLAIVKRLLKRFNSKILLESEPGTGSLFSFVIEFPLHKGEPEKVQEYKIELSSLKGLKVLVVDDNRVNILLLEKLLAKWEIQTAAASDGEQALIKLQNNDFDLILMDIHMPVMNGYETTLAIRALSDKVKANVPVIAVTASVSNGADEMAKKAGMQDYLPKPFQIEQLYEKLNKIYKAVNI